MSTSHHYQTRSVSAAQQPPVGEDASKKKKSSKRPSLCEGCGLMDSPHSYEECPIVSFSPHLELASVNDLTAKTWKMYIASQGEEKVFYLTNDGRGGLGRSKYASVRLSQLSSLMDNAAVHAVVQAKAQEHFNMGRSDVFWKFKTTSQRDHYIEKLTLSMYHEYLLYRYILLETGVTAANSSTQCHTKAAKDVNLLPLPITVRMTENVCQQHQLGNSVVALIGRTAFINQMAQSYRQDLHAHQDRVPQLFAMPLDTILQYDSEKAMKRYFHEQLQLSDDCKVKIKHHLIEVLFVGIQRLWDPSKQKGMKQPEVDQICCPYFLARRRDAADISVLLAVDVTGGGNIEIDIPGGKRELFETSFEAAIRETWEEIGVDLQDAYINGKDDIPRVATEMRSEWIFAQHRELDYFSTYVTIHKDLWFELHPTAVSHQSSSATAEVTSLTSRVGQLKVSK